MKAALIAKIAGGALAAGAAVAVGVVLLLPDGDTVGSQPQAWIDDPLHGSSAPPGTVHVVAHAADPDAHRDRTADDATPDDRAPDDGAHGDAVNDDAASGAATSTAATTSTSTSTTVTVHPTGGSRPRHATAPVHRHDGGAHPRLAVRGTVHPRRVRGAGVTHAGLY